eukprot:7710875-Alexandrium_andersonii.AAC.1
MSDSVLVQLRAVCQITHLILRNRAAGFGVLMDCGGWVGSNRLVEVLSLIHISEPTRLALI